MSDAKTSDKKGQKYKTAELKVLKILQKLESLKLSDGYVSQIRVPAGKRINLKDKLKLPKYFYVLIAAVVVGLVYWTSEEWSSDLCLLDAPSATKAMFRPPEDCNMCREVTGVHRVSNITAEEFESDYAYGSTPLIVSGAASQWRAVREFNYEFFKKFYQDSKMGTRTNDCFYFAYKSGLNSLQEVFSMDESRANLSGEPWYVGWSTCFDEETRRLRSYYNRPYFLPKTAESDMVDWIFMGGPGQGAHMHVDSVKHMSWQAQVRGRKRWELAPPPECLYRCRWFSFVVEPGEILVVDTNRWYHRTNVLPGDISITIGAEYD
ncbi:hypothetical protein JYU34_006308 [Plutella xylostella]|uniref:Cupin-like domain-containing protein n=1 Tax=Plutella xylostella TaxID=51655 RepID=A0ABQ7QRT4_PLUXY|nr:hypothetical protein JYU34_006308 [Plutella xylostella]